MSVPGSLSTGADSPVMAASLTKPDALDDVAVAGDGLALVDDDDVAPAQLGRADVLERAVGRRRWAVVTERVRRRVAAWARPRASATASA